MTGTGGRLTTRRTQVAGDGRGRPWANPPSVDEHSRDFPEIILVDVKMSQMHGIEAKDMSRPEPVNVPQIGAVVRCKVSLLRGRARTSGRVKAVLSQDYGPAVVIQSIWGDEVTVTATEYSRFFEECGPRDVARDYWEST